MNEPRLADALLDKFTVDEIMCVIDWFVSRIERQSPKRLAELRQYAARALRPSSKMQSL